MSLSQIGLLYNPQLQSAEITEKLFVIRQKQFEFLLNKILQEKKDSIPQHYLIIAQRGMGKTTLLKRMEVELHKEQYRQQFIPLLYREEQYNVKDLAEFWLNTLDALADSLQSENYPSGILAEIDNTIRSLSNKTPKVISEEAYKYLIKTCHGLSRRPVMLIDNINLVFSRLENNKNKQEQWELRKLLSENEAPIVVSAGVTVTTEVAEYGMPFYDFFQIQYLRKLNYEEFISLLKNLALVTNSDKDVFVSIQESNSRKKALLELTGGSPRLTVMLFEQITRGFSTNINDDLEILADSITPLYKAKFEELPPQQQIVIDAIALNWDAISLRKLSAATRMKNNQLSPLLKRLINDGWIETTPAYKAKGNAYYISERFFNIYYLIRNSSRRHKDKIYCLSKFLECFYGKDVLERISDDLLKQDICSKEQMRLHLAVSMIKALKISKRKKIKEKTFETFLKDDKLRKEFDFPEKYLLLRKGESLLNEQNYNEAINYFDKVIASNQENTQAWYLKGNSLLKLEKHEEALECLNKLIEIQPKGIYTYIAKGNLLFNLKRFDEAITCFDNALKINPKNELALGKKGEIFAELEQYEKAISCFDIMLKNRPKHSLAWLAKGEMLNKLEKYDNALDCIDKALKLNPDYKPAYHYKARVLTALERNEEAIYYFDKCIEFNPEDDHFKFLKSSCLLSLGRYDESLDYLNQAIKLNPEIDYYWSCKGMTLNILQRSTESLDCFDHAIKLNPENDSFWGNKGFVLTCMEHYGEAISCFKEAIRLNPENENAWRDNGICLYNMEQYQEAIDSLDKSINLNSSNTTAWFYKAGCLLGLERYKEAIIYYDEVIKQDPEDKTALCNKGYALAEAGNYKEATLAYETSLLIDKDQLSPKLSLLFLYRDKLDKMNRAIELFNSINEKNIHEEENKILIMLYYLHSTLFALYNQNKGIAKDSLLQAFDILEKKDKVSLIANHHSWVKFGSIIIKLNYGSWLLTILEEKGYDTILSPYYTAVKALDIMKQDSKKGNVDAEIYLKNRAIEISDPARLIIEKMKRYMD